MVLDAILLIAVLFFVFIGYHAGELYKKEQDRLDKQDAAYKRYTADMERAGVTFPPIDTTGIVYYIKYNHELLTLEEWETEPHQFTAYVSNHLYRQSKPPVAVNNQLHLFD